MGVTPERLLWAGGCLLVVVASSATGFLAKNPVIAQVAKQEVSGSDPFRVLGSTRKVLLVGAGSSAHSRKVKLQRWGTADLVLLVTIEPSERVLGVEAIPSTMKVGERSLAEVFESDGPEAVLSMGGLEALLSMGGIIATDYAVLDFDSMISFIDRMGGIEVKVEQKLQHVDKAGGLYVDLEPGYYHLDGRLALGYLRVKGSALAKSGDTGWVAGFIQSLREGLDGKEELVADLAGLVSMTSLSSNEIAAMLRALVEVGPSGVKIKAGD